jgi:hypothetical protein
MMTDIQTPNFAMNTSDIDPDANPEEKRYTSHVFRSDFSLYAIQSFRPNYSISSAQGNFPPAILFDAVYAAAVLRHFGTQVLRDAVTAAWQDTGKVRSAADANLLAMTEQRAAHEEMIQAQAKERGSRHAAHNPDVFDMLMMIPYVLVPPDELRAAMREAEETAVAAEQIKVTEKVNAWARPIAAE